MNIKSLIQLFLISIVILICFIMYSLYFSEKNDALVLDENKILKIEEDVTDDTLDDLSFRSKDLNGNSYVIEAKKGKVNLDDKNQLLLNTVTAKIFTKNKSPIIITSNFANYNTVNYETKFFDEVVINFEKNKIESDNFDFFLSKNNAVIYNNIKVFSDDYLANADKININLANSDVIIDMFDKSDKINLIKK